MLGYPPYDLKVKKLLDAADIHTKCTGDKRQYCTLDEMILLLQNGANIGRLNIQQSGPSAAYLHIVRYEGREFVSTSKKRIDASRYLSYLN